MSDTSTTHVIFFIAAILVASSLAGVFIGMSSNIASAIESRGNSYSDKLETSITIVNDQTMMPYSNSTLTVYVKNTGSSILLPTDLLFMVDGSDQNSSNWSIIGSSAEWAPSTVLQVQLNIILANGDHSVKVVTSNGISDQMDFRI